MNNTQLQQYISAHNKQVELIDSLRKQINRLEQSNKRLTMVIQIALCCLSSIVAFILLFGFN